MGLKQCSVLGFAPFLPFPASCAVGRTPRVCWHCPFPLGVTRPHLRTPGDPGVNRSCLFGPRPAFSRLLPKQIDLFPPEEAAAERPRQASESQEPLTWEPFPCPWLTTWAAARSILHVQAHTHTCVRLLVGRSWRVFSAFNTKVKNARFWFINGWKREEIKASTAQSPSVT